MSETAFVRYRHKSRGDIEYDVEDVGNGWQPLIVGKPSGERHVRIRTVKNHFHGEKGRHIPAFTYMPADRFLEIYERV